MKNKITLLLRLFVMICTLLFIVPVGQAQVKLGFNIDGSIQGLKSGSKLLLLIKKEDKVDTVSQTTANNVLFVFKNVKLPYRPDFYLICIQREFVENLQLFLEQAGDVKIWGELRKWPSVTVRGSKLHADYLKAEIIREQVMDIEFVAKYPTRTAPPDTILFYTRKGIEAVIEQMPNSDYLPAMVARWTYTAGKFIPPIEMKKSFYEGLSKDQKNSYYGKILARQVGAKIE